MSLRLLSEGSTFTVSPVLESLHEVALQLILVDLFQVAASKFVVALAGLQHVIPDHKHRMSHRHEGPFETSTSGDAFKLR